MAMDLKEIEKYIRDAFPDALVKIDDLAGDGDHYSATITSSEFSGGFAHLAIMDTNKDGVVSVKDKGFGNLYVWADTNYDGKCTTEEVKPLTETRITSIPSSCSHFSNSKPSKCFCIFKRSCIFKFSTISLCVSY